MKMEGGDWFYTKAVKENFMKPKNFYKNEKEIKGFSGYGRVGNVKCGDLMEMWIKIKDDKIKDVKWKTFGSLHPDEKVLMQDYSYKKAKDVLAGDRIIDGWGKSNLVETITEKEYKGKMLTFVLSTSRFYNFTVTPNHPIQAVKRNTVSLINRVSGTHWSEVSQQKAMQATSQIYSASELNKTDFLLFHVPKETKENKELTEDICTLLGYYVSDGGLPSKNRVIFYFGLEETEFADEIEQICKKNNWKAIKYKRNTENVLCIQINEPKIVSLLRAHGGGPSEKIFSDTIMKLPPKKQMKIIDAYVNGDGWILQQKENWKPQHFISTSSETLANQLQLMLARNKIFAPQHYREPRQFVSRGKTYQNNGEINLIFRKSTSYSRVKFSKKENAFLIPIQKIVSSEYHGKITDLSLFENPNTYRIKGISIHNCASAIASTSMLSVMLKEKGGMKLEKALKLTGKDIMDRLGGLPAIKIHCSVLGDQALRAAIYDYKVKNNRDDLKVNKPVEIDEHAH